MSQQMEGTDGVVIKLRFNDDSNEDVDCYRDELIQHSDYFEAMFRPNSFRESQSTEITLRDVQRQPVKTILKLIRNRQDINELDEEYLILVLQTSRNLQFVQVSDQIEKRLDQMLDVTNCLYMWYTIELLDVGPLVHNAKLMSLMYFNEIRKQNCFLTMRIEHLTLYLRNVHLYCSHEITIFEAINEWLHENKDTGNQTPCTVHKLLRCINFRSCLVSEIHTMLETPGSIAQDPHIREILQCIVAIRKKDQPTLANVSESCLGDALKFLGEKERNRGGFPCLFVQNPKELNVVRPQTVFYLDDRPEGIQLTELFRIESGMVENRWGYKMLGHKNFVFLFGGEFIVEHCTNDWCFDVHIYDVIKRSWKTIKMPFRRRHFLACAVDNTLFIVGGTGPMRILQNNFFSYNLDADLWTKELCLPTKQASLQQLQICSYQNRLFLLDISNRSGYSLIDDITWHCYTFNRCVSMPPYSNQQSLFSYQNLLYVKADKLYELYVEETQLHISRTIPLNGAVSVDSRLAVDSVVSKNKLYVLKSHESDQGKDHRIYCLEILNLDGDDESRDVISNFGIFEDKVVFKSQAHVKLFSVFHPHFMYPNETI